MKFYLAGYERHSSVNGPGVRYVIFFQGCTHHCSKCQNPDTWNIEHGKVYNTQDIIDDILKTKYIDGVTFSGGDPFYQPDALKEIASKLKEKNINIWCYTGWTYEDILNGKAGADSLEVLSYLDVLIDGPFIYSLLSTECIFRGSSNQRLIDVKKSLEAKKVVEVTSFDYGL